MVGEGQGTRNAESRTWKLPEAGEPDATETGMSGSEGDGWVRLQSLMELLLRAAFGK